MGRVTSRPLWVGTASPSGVGDEFGHWQITDEAVRLRAYFISLETGGANPRQDWMRAEREFLAEAGCLSCGSDYSEHDWSYRR